MGVGAVMVRVTALVMLFGVILVRVAALNKFYATAERDDVRFILQSFYDVLLELNESRGE